MTFDGISAVEQRIQAIQQQIQGVTSSSSTAATAGSGATTGADFASLLTDAMNTQTAVDSGGLGSSTDTSGASSSSGVSGGDLSSLLNEAGALNGSASGDALGATSSNSSSLTSLVQSLTGTGAGSTTSSDLSSLLTSLTGETGSSTSPDISSLLSSLTGASGTTAVSGSVTNPTTQQFVDTALSQAGKPYVWGSTALASDPNPPSFDCSELTKWAAARSGVTIPDGAAHQYVWLKEQGATMSVQQALQTPGALLFHFASEPQPGLTGEPPVARRGDQPRQRQDDRGQGPRLRRRRVRRHRSLQLRRDDPGHELTG